MSQMLFWMIVAYSSFVLTCLAKILYEWQERRSEQRAVERRVKALRWRVR